MYSQDSAALDSRTAAVGLSSASYKRPRGLRQPKTSPAYISNRGTGSSTRGLNRESEQMKTSLHPVQLSVLFLQSSLRYPGNIFQVNVFRKKENIVAFFSSFKAWATVCIQFKLVRTYLKLNKFLILCQ